MVRYLLIFFAGVVLDLFWFPLYPVPFPALNTKMILAVVGVVLLGMQLVRYRRYEIDKYLWGAVILAATYSVVNLVAVEVNDEFDFSYANYITTFFVWVFSAHAAISTIRWVHGKVSLKLLMWYLLAISVFQCVLAIVIDNVPAVANAVEMIQDNSFYRDRVDRLYGLGAALDPAGVRFGIVLLLMAFVLCVDEQVQQSKLQIALIIFSFIIISVLGNMIARTTTVGMAMGVGVIILSTGLYRFVITPQSVKIYSIVGIALLIFIPLGVVLYNTDPFFYGQMRFAFEGFFNWVETGTWRTGSTDLLATMWRWPETTKGWIIGTGLFGTFLYGTDIGYCRLILYSGIVGFSVFALFFVYHAYVFINTYRRYRYMFVLLLAMSFIIWYKVSTDLFFFYALLYVFRDEQEAGYSPKLTIA